MNQTEHYQLNQWEGTDRILRSDFNADNRKIDEALAQIKASVPRVLLADITAQEQCNQIDLPVTQLNLLQYLRLELDVFIPLSYSGTKQLMFRTNGMETGYTSRNDYSSPERTTDRAGEVGNGSICLLSPPREGSRIFSFLIQSYTTAFVSPVTWDALETLNFLPLPGNDIPAGTRIRLYGFNY